jgi:hypothetical protein
VVFVQLTSRVHDLCGGKGNADKWRVRDIAEIRIAVFRPYRPIVGKRVEVREERGESVSKEKGDALARRQGPELGGRALEVRPKSKAAM